MEDVNMLTYRVTCSNAEIAYVHATSVSDALNEVNYQFGLDGIDAEIADEEPRQVMEAEADYEDGYDDVQSLA